mmetsp:Transcript_16858/g.32904  ORF Transcript_16858/g.32904 Transcript_16858/m.32904 type:complete len:680 (-) Transcript_16858:439-2478(-)|eukprot:CAMPEP_0171489880 /NCGR_PEP_ID=MMETSP0958-20121227/3006_1 /TAXON_ID=87120 /ORGANISM="Aurantiochytrium limacinum, Strain ATCCMYA-1381" /LENGTH=679 /DNA_ID=CAMNT_0012023149 /DNA_START=545 /DNA_END=2584 /DNA_ORIENTATION=-
MLPFKRGKNKNSSTNKKDAAKAYKLSKAAKKLGLNGEEENRVMAVLTPLLHYLYENALNTDNLFMRVGGNDPEADAASFQMAAKDLLRSRDAPGPVLEHYDVHVWANVVKLFLKEMNKPLIPHHLSEVFLSRDLEQTGLTKTIAEIVSEVLLDVPHKNFENLRDLCMLLRDCLTDQDRLAHMFGAILLDPPPSSDAVPDPQVMMKQAQNMTLVMKCLIGQASDVFDVPPPTREKPQGRFLATQPITQTLPAGFTPHNSAMPSGGGHEGAVSGQDSRERIGSFDTAVAMAADPLYQGHHIGESTVPVADNNRVSRFVTVLYDHEPEEDDELYLVEGDQVKIIGQVNQDWYTGLKMLPDGSTEMGIFPCTYCGLTGTEEFIEPVDAAEAANRTPSQANTQDIQAPDDLSRASHVLALYDFEPREDVELQLYAGERIKLISTDDPDWWFGSTEDGREGMFPITYVGPDPNATLRDTPGSRPTVVDNIIVAGNASEASPTIVADADNIQANIFGTGPPAPPRRSTSLSQGVTAIPGGSEAIPSPKNAQFRMKPTQPPTSPMLSQTKSSAGSAAVGGRKWPVTKERYNLCCRNFDKYAENDPDGSFVKGKTASEFLLRSQLSKATIARILELADIDGDRRLDRDEFVVAHHLAISISREGMPEPSVLPDYLIPKTKKHVSLSSH